ncbi:hypothetical protein TM1040_1802 [Ruegeria sp. TM1040]|uniref:hypothetical protein n=1 Tax=Ruegeria sp. (strain TM1040) TaxID=292414 RepID=UPI00004630CD|nr:hypothetical protein [Ruegeria sp. TM1040]ABF64535.1 hypothetical protein TM1040_1802 [Ruegeria sp. TM1040]
MAESFSLKDQLFNVEKTRYLAGLFDAASVEFDPRAFEADVMARLLDLELKARINWIAEMLSKHVPGPLDQVAPVIFAALPPPLDPSLRDDDFGDFIFAPLGEWVADLTKTEADLPLALDLLEAVTQRFSMEFAIRPLLKTWPDPVLARMSRWAGHAHYHVRRLASEGTRPRLPWGLAVNLPLDAPLPILDRLHGDDTRFVTRSVANHLNDIAKKDPQIVVDQLTAWQARGEQAQKELDWMTSHALRGLIKAGDPRALRLLGYDPELDLSAELELPGRVRIGEKLMLGARLQGGRGARVLVDYALTFQRAGGKTSTKVFKWKTGTLGADGLSLQKTHPLKAQASTFTLLPGAHRVTLMVNGQPRASGEVEFLA